MQLAAREDGVREVGLQTEKSPMKKGSIFSRLGNPVGGAEMEKQDSLKVQPEAKQKYSPRRQVQMNGFQSVHSSLSYVRIKMKNMFLAKKTGNKKNMMSIITDLNKTKI